MFKTRSLISYFKNEKGFSMMIALMSVIVLSIIGISMFTISNNTSKAAERERDDQAVYYIAEAGLNHVKVNLIDNINNPSTDSSKSKLENILDKISTNPELDLTNIKVYNFENHLNDPNKKTKAFVKLTNNPANQFTILSRGTIEGSGNAIGRAVSQTILIDNDGNIIDPGSIKEICIIDENFTPCSAPTPGTVPGGGSNPGDSGDNKDSNCQGHGNDKCQRDPDKSECPPHNKNCKDDDSGDDGDSGSDGSGGGGSDDNEIENPVFGESLVYTTTSGTFNQTGTGNGSKGFTHSKYDVNDIKLPTKQEFISYFNNKNDYTELKVLRNPQNLDKNYILNNINGNDITFNTSTSKNLFIDSSVLLSDKKQTTTLKFDGEGTINIYINGDLDINEGILNIKAENSKVKINIFIKNDLNLDKKGTINADANIYSLNSTSNVDIDKNLNIKGSLVSNTSSITVNGDSSTTIKGICAPNASYSSSGTYNVNGKIVVNSFSHNGSASVGKTTDKDYNPCSLQ
ncbi:pilus assembly PilX N-terminal domain-containing protein [Lysinibacillus antri]|uniref:DUF7305 domain-containing protein n=1 Tax=Lysinibacillus antri TaxID=2498145 RepID=A0A432LE68_9BACI|nr:pilus assembly PilX N-terminal domain-containing protein [Lysinibacillus antri]RUL55133.1 hypothetical protein EK386_05240 [Lysinibacillus antri]